MRNLDSVVQACERWRCTVSQQGWCRRPGSKTHPVLPTVSGGACLRTVCLSGGPSLSERTGVKEGVGHYWIGVRILFGHIKHLLKYINHIYLRHNQSTEPIPVNTHKIVLLRTIGLVLQLQLELSEDNGGQYLRSGWQSIQSGIEGDQVLFSAGEIMYPTLTNF